MLASGRSIEWLSQTATLREVVLTATLVQEAHKARMKDMTQAIQLGVLGSMSKDGARTMQRTLDKED